MKCIIEKYLLVPPLQRVLAPLFVVEEVDNVLIKDVSMKDTVLGQPCFFSIQDMATL